MEDEKQDSREDLLNKIRAAANRLNDAAEQTTKAVEALERELLDIEPGVTVWSAILQDGDYTFEDDTGSQLAHRTVTLGFAKTKKKWGIAVREQVKGKGSESGADAILHDEVSLLRKADRELRILAAPHLDELMQDILGELEARLERLGAFDQSDEAQSPPEGDGAAEAAE